jgi:hypothetical protein
MNVFACLVHEEPACVRDLVANLRHLDPDSRLVLYNGGRDRSLLRSIHSADKHVVVHPEPRVMSWGDLLDFALDCMRLAGAAFDYETVTVVDSDQLLVMPGWSGAIAMAIRDQPTVGLFGNPTATASSRSGSDPPTTAAAERDLWYSILETLPGGAGVYPQWTFWPSTVVTRAACETLLSLFDRDDVRMARQQSHLLATEEILIPTFVRAAGFQTAASPESFAYVKFREQFSEEDVTIAMRTPGSYWMHPIPRRYDHPVRRAVRRAYHGYVSASPRPARFARAVGHDAGADQIHRHGQAQG